MLPAQSVSWRTAFFNTVLAEDDYVLAAERILPFALSRQPMATSRAVNRSRPRIRHKHQSSFSIFAARHIISLANTRLLLNKDQPSR
jgi:hypothetical protein